MIDGWIKLHRGILQHWIFQNEAYLKAWVTILISVNFETKKVLIDKELIICERGQSCMSLKSWTKLFGKNWTLQKTRTFLNLLEKDKMIVKKSTSNTTKLTVCNYESYQSEQQTNNNQLTIKQQTNNKQLTTTKESKERKERKEESIPTLPEFLKYCEEKTGIKYPKIKYSATMKYEAWVENNWRTGKNEPIKNWKTTLLNTIPHLKEEKEEIKNPQMKSISDLTNKRAS